MYKNFHFENLLYGTTNDCFTIYLYGTTKD